MKTVHQRHQFGQAAFEPIRSVHFDEQTDAFEVEFDSGAAYQLARGELLQANGINGDSPKGIDSIWIDAETRSGFFVRFTDGREAEASWELVKEHRPRS